MALFPFFLILHHFVTINIKIEKKVPQTIYHRYRNTFISFPKVKMANIKRKYFFLQPETSNFFVFIPLWSSFSHERRRPLHPPWIQYCLYERFLSVEGWSFPARLGTQLFLLPYTLNCTLSVRTLKAKDPLGRSARLTISPLSPSTDFVFTSSCQTLMTLLWTSSTYMHRIRTYTLGNMMEMTVTKLKELYSGGRK